ncbi:MAG: glycosyltransferase [Planctomycetota bacterium]|jgi:glycosyltransferase involved in cell wall biosynthesis
MTPSPTDLYRGPAATVQRYREGLQRRGHLCELFGSTGEGGIKQSLEGTIGRFKPDIVHAHDAFRTGLQLLGLHTPWVVSVSGEDLNVDMVEGPHAPLVCEVYRRAKRVLVPSPSSASLLEERVPETVGRIDIVPRAVQGIQTGGTDLRRSLGIPRHRVIILLAGGLRPVKGQHRAISLVRILRSAGVDAELIIVGPEQDEEYAKGLKDLAAEESRIRILPAISHERMGAILMDADIVLNTSLDEGMSPVILEAGMLGRPVVASDTAGNRELVRHKETGLLFDDEETMSKCVLALVRKRSAAGAMGVRMREEIKRRFDPEMEIDRLLSAYAAA